MNSVSKPGSKQAYSQIQYHIDRVRKRIRAIGKDIRPYPVSRRNFDIAKTSLLHWLDICERLMEGYEQATTGGTLIEFLPEMSAPWIRAWLSKTVNSVEAWFNLILNPRIAIEAELLIHELLCTFDADKESFSLIPASGFKRKRISEVMKESSPPKIPGSNGFTYEVDKHIDTIAKDIHLILFEESQYDNILTWPNLLHEALHIIFDVKDWARELKGLSMNESLLQELLIDIVCTRYFGPAYSLSLAIQCERFPYGESRFYPNMGPRLLGQVKSLEYLLQTEGNIYEDAIDFASKYVMKAHQAMPKSDVPTVDDTYKAVTKINEKIINKLLPETNYTEGLVSDIAKIRKLYKIRIPVAATPRTLFNAFIDDEFIESPPSADYIALSLKKWYVFAEWSRINGEQEKTLKRYL